MWIFLEPTDVWLFRDGRPFDAGSDHRARSIFPPTPLTLQGIVRSKVLAERHVSLGEYAEGVADQSVIDDIGLPAQGYGRLRLRGPIVARSTDHAAAPIQFFPVPADVVKSVSQPAVLRPLRSSPFHTSMPSGLLPLWHCETEARSRYERHWIDEEALRSYLENEDLSGTVLTEEGELFQRESRFHVGIDSATKRPQESEAGGHLYQIEFIRTCEGMGLLLEVTTQDGSPLTGFPESSLLQMGGKGRGGVYRKVQVGRVDHRIAEQPLESGRFKVVFTTPAYFDSDEPWRPAGNDWSRFFNGAPVRLVAAALAGPQAIGGARVDLTSQRGGADHSRRQGNGARRGFQKPIRRFVPAGSVYFFEADGPVTYRGQPLTETPAGEADFGQIGFGQILIGRWSYV